MNKEMEKLIQQMLYNMTKEEVLDTLSNIESPEVLYVYAYNYNWDDGFEIPEKIINKKCCDLCRIFGKRKSSGEDLSETERNRL